KRGKPTSIHRVTKEARKTGDKSAKFPAFPIKAPAAPISLTSPSLVLGLMPATRRNKVRICRSRSPVPGCGDPRIGSPLLPLTGLEPLRPRRLVESIANRLRTHSILWEGTSVDFEGKQMTIYRTRYRDPKEHRWVSKRPETRVVAEVHRAQRFAPRKLEIG